MTHPAAATSSASSIVPNEPPAAGVASRSSATGGMIQNETGCSAAASLPEGLDPKDLSHPHLTPRQVAAIAWLLQGLSDATVAARVGVARVTVYRWRALHAPFRLELQRQQRAMWLQGRERLRAMLHPALDVIERQLTDPADPKAALRAAGMLLRLASPRRVDPPGPQDPREARESVDDIIEAVRATGETVDEDG